jgi:hypothetical protein
LSTGAPSPRSTGQTVDEFKLNAVDAYLEDLEVLATPFPEELAVER